MIKKQSKIDEIDIKESAKEQGEELKTKSLKIENTKVQTYTKSSIKLRNKCRFEPLSMISMILLSILVSTAGAGKIKSEDKNEIPRREPTWANPRTETRKHEDLLINAFDCMDNNLPSTQISLRPPKDCVISDGSAYEKGQQKKSTNSRTLRTHPH